MTRSAIVSHPARFAALAILALSAALVVAACGGGGTPSIVATTQGPQSTAAGPVATAGGGTTGAAAACRSVTNLKSLDYAFGASLSMVRSLDAASKARTLNDLQQFAAAAPPELAGPAADLVVVWTKLVADPNSVTESDPKLTSATKAFTDWLAANC